MLFKESNEYEYAPPKNGKRNTRKTLLSRSHRLLPDELVNLTADISLGDLVELSGRSVSQQSRSDFGYSLDDPQLLTRGHRKRPPVSNLSLRLTERSLRLGALRIELSLVETEVVIGERLDVDRGGRGGRDRRVGDRGSRRLGGTSLEMFNLHTTIKDTDTHHSEQVVSSVGMVIDTTEEGSSGVSTDSTLDEVGTTRVVLNERRTVVNETVDSNKRAFLGFSLEIVPTDNRKVVARLGPFKLVGLLLEKPQFHGVLTLLNLVVRETLQVRGKTELRHGPDEPLSGVILEPLDSVSEVLRELMVEVVVALANGAKSSDDMVSRRVLVVEGLLTKPMGKRVDTESRLNDAQVSKSPIVSVP